ncbi:hypothetical protein [Streptomyces sp. SYSU K21746]
MRGMRAGAAVTVLGAAALCLGTPTATAADAALRAAGCETSDVTVSEGRSGTAKVEPAAEPGAEYDVTLDCAGEEGLAGLTIADAEDAPETDAEHDDTDEHEDTAYGDTEHQLGGHDEPGAWAESGPPTGVRQGVKAGVGGSLTGIAPVPTAAGAALIAGAAGAGVHLMRRHRRS